MNRRYLQELWHPAQGAVDKNRILHSLLGIKGGKATGEIGLDSHTISEDAAGILYRKKVSGAPCLPLMSLGSLMRHYDDEYEWNDAITSTYPDSDALDEGCGHQWACAYL